MYPETTPTTPIEVGHGHTLAAGEQASARPCRTRPPKLVGYARALLDPADLRTAVAELNQLGVHSENIYLDQAAAGGAGDDGIQAALQALRVRDTLVVANLTRLGRSLAAITELIDQLGDRGAGLNVGGELFDTLPQLQVLKMLTQFQVDLVERALVDAEWVHSRRTDMRKPHHRVDAVQSVWLQQLYDAGMPRLQLGEHFGVSRATVFRVANPAVS